MARSQQDLVHIARYGGGLDISAKDHTQDNLVQLATNTAAGKGKLILRYCVQAYKRTGEYRRGRARTCHLRRSLTGVVERAPSIRRPSFRKRLGLPAQRQPLISRTKWPRNASTRTDQRQQARQQPEMRERTMKFDLMTILAICIWSLSQYFFSSAAIRHPGQDGSRLARVCSGLLTLCGGKNETLMMFA
jgi:hypothetical protein